MQFETNFNIFEASIIFLQNNMLRQWKEERESSLLLIQMNSLETRRMKQ